MAPGRFITLEGGEGAGKSTLARSLKERIEALGLRATVTREPGGSPKAEAIREVILSGQVKQHGPLVEALMFSAARIDHSACRLLGRGTYTASMSGSANRAS